MAHEYFFSQHMVEARTNSLRLRMSLLGIFVAAVGVCSPAIFSSAATSTTATVDGAKILTTGAGQYGGSTSGPFSAATIKVTRTAYNTSTNSNANPFTFASLGAVAAGETYTVSISPAVTTGYTLKGSTWCLDACSGYNPQTSNFKAGLSVTLTLQRNHNYHMRWIYAIPAATPPPAPPTPAPVQPPVTTPTPVLAARLSAAAPVSQNIVAPPSTAPPSPANFEVLMESGNALVNLSWTEVADPAVIKAYRLERSTDQSQWNVLTESSVGLNFRDDQVAFATHYFYRVSAIDQNGINSDYALQNIETSTFTQNATSTINGNFVSADGVANVGVVAGTLNAEAAICSVLSSPVKITKATGVVLAGPYELVCKNTSGNVISEFNEPVTWIYNLKTKNKGHENVRGVHVGASGGLDVVPTVSYDTKGQKLTFNQPNATTTAVLASKNSTNPVGIISFVLVFLAVAGGAIYVLRTAQRQKYADYIRSRYYNL